MQKLLHSKLFKIIVSLGAALLIFWICPPCFSKVKLGVVLGLILIFINFSGFFSQLTWLTHVCRFLVGGLFIFSGFIKSNDPLGFSYKLEEYFEVFKADTGLGLFDWFAHGSLTWAIIICVSEVALGFMLLIGFKRKLTLWLLLAQIVFFTFLTFYSACYNKVTHCGCFGDFIKLTPWESFWKDLVLLVLITVMFVGKDNINELLRPMFCNLLTAIAIAAAIWFPIHTYRNLPVFDFRPYAPGLSICDGMKPGPNFKPAVYESHFMYKNIKTGDTTEFTDKNYPWKDTLNWAFHRSLPTVQLQKEIDGPKISDLNISDMDGNNITDSILKNKNYNFLIICYDLTKTNQDKELMAKINDFYSLCEKEKVKVLAITASNAEQIGNFKHTHNAMFDFATADGTVLKTMVRANPGLMLMKDCKVIANWHHNNWPVYSHVKEKLMK